MRARTTRTVARAVTGAAATAAVAVLAAGLPAAAQVAPDPLPTTVPGPVVPGPVFPKPPTRPLAWEVELKETWTSPTWSQPAGRTSVAVHLDCGDVISFRLPQYYIKVVAEDGRIEPAVMPRPVPCGVTHTITWNEIAGKYHLFLAKASHEGVVLRGKAAVRTP